MNGGFLAVEWMGLMIMDWRSGQPDLQYPVQEAGRLAVGLIHRVALRGEEKAKGDRDRQHLFSYQTPRSVSPSLVEAGTGPAHPAIGRAGRESEASIVCRKPADQSIRPKGSGALNTGF